MPVFSVTYRKSEVVFSENSQGKEMYIIYSGKVKIYKERTPGKRHILLSTLKRGDFFGEMALVDLSPRSATAIAAEDNTQLLVLDDTKFLYLLRQQPEFALTLMQRLCQRLREANQAVAELKQAQPKGGKK